MAETLEKVKISELPEVADYYGLYTIGTDGRLHSVKVPIAILGRIGSLDNLTTNDKTTLVAAINEAARSGGGGGSAVGGYVVVDSIANLPDPGQPQIGSLVGDNLYLYVIVGGDTLDGKYKNCGPFRGPQGPQGIQGVQGHDGAPGPAGPAGVTSVVITVGSGSGTPSGTATVNNGVLTIALDNIKGADGAAGQQGPQGNPGQQGPQGETGPAGPGINRVVIAVGSSTGVPSGTASLVDGVLTISLAGLKGEQGNSGYTGDISQLEIVNNLYQGGESAALSAEQGKILNEKIENKFIYLTEAEFEALTSYEEGKIYCTYEE